MSFLELLIDLKLDLPEWATLLSTSVGEPVTVVDRLEDLPQRGCGATIAAVTGDVQTHINIISPPTSISHAPIEFLQSLSLATGARILIADDATPNPFQFQELNEGTISPYAADASIAEDDCYRRPAI